MRKSHPTVEGVFKCSSCEFSVKFDDKGPHPRYLKPDINLEDAYIMRDPFVDGGSGGIIIGADCCVCKAGVCVSPECSFFYAKRYCKDCAIKNLDHFPEEIRKELLRSLKGH
ncbi:Cysteine-rich DPF motif domain-containing protein 1 [Taenia solium]